MTLITCDAPASADLRSSYPRAAVFYGLATVLALAAWVPYGAQLAGKVPTHIPAIVPIAGQYSPAIAALILVTWEGRLIAFLKRSLNPLFAPRWFVVPLLIPLLMAAGLIALHALDGGVVPTLASLGDVQSHLVKFFTAMNDASGGASNAMGVLLAHWASLGLIPALLTFFGLAIANGGVSEEAGWRGYMLAGMLPGRRVLTAALLVGFFWGLWHTGPEFWAGVLASNWKVLAIPLEYTLGTVPLTIMIAWVFLNAKKSLLPGMLLHACYNGTFFFLTQIWMPQHPVVTIPEWLAASYVAACVVLAIGHRTLLARETASDFPVTG